MEQNSINNLSLCVATENGTGSQSANLIIAKSVFRMGIPVASKNLFPSNIAGLPTWFSIRVNEEGYLSYKPQSDILVLMNPQTLEKDLRAAKPKAEVIVDEGILTDSLKELAIERGLKLHIYPIRKLAKAEFKPAKVSKLLANMVYVGILSKAIGIDQSVLEGVIRDFFGGKEEILEKNLRAIEIGRSTDIESFDFQLQPRKLVGEGTDYPYFMEGNQAGAYGALLGGSALLSWYPITPSSSFCENLEGHFKKFRKPEHYSVVQAEDEMAAAGMVIGAGWAGARAITATSGPGLSLMSELVGLGYFAEIPGVFVIVQRMGPSTGLPTRTSQGDLLSMHELSHGDCRHPVLIPSSPDEAYSMTQEALELSEKIQTPVFVALDLDLGMNLWPTRQLPYPKEGSLARGKVLDEKGLAAAAEFARYKDKDGDGVGYRTLPGNNHPSAAYFARGTGHDESANYSEDPEVWAQNMERLNRKLAQAPLPKSEVDATGRSTLGIIAFGTTDLCIDEVREGLPCETNYLRLRSLPAGQEVRDFIGKHKKVLVLEQNYGGQVCGLLQKSFPDLAPKIASVTQFNGLPCNAEHFIRESERHVQ